MLVKPLRSTTGAEQSDTYTGGMLPVQREEIIQKGLLSRRDKARGRGVNFDVGLKMLSSRRALSIFVLTDADG